MESDRLFALGQVEVERHEAEFYRLRDMADKLTDNMEWHTKQIAHWNAYLAELATEHTATIIPFPTRDMQLPFDAC